MMLQSHMNRTQLFFVAALLLAAVGVIVGQRTNRTTITVTPATQIIEVPAPITANTPQVSPPATVNAPPGYGTQDQAIIAYKNIAGTATDTIRQGLENLRRVSQNVPPDIDTNDSSREAWARQAGTAATFISGGGKMVTGITNVPDSCYESHRILIDVARRANTFAETYIANVRTIKNGGAVPEVEKQAQGLETSLSAFDASLTRL